MSDVLEQLGSQLGQFTLNDASGEEFFLFFTVSIFLFNLISFGFTLFPKLYIFLKKSSTHSKDEYDLLETIVVIASSVFVLCILHVLPIVLLIYLNAEPIFILLLFFQMMLSGIIMYYSVRNAFIASIIIDQPEEEQLRELFFAKSGPWEEREVIKEIENPVWTNKRSPLPVIREFYVVTLDEKHFTDMTLEHLKALGDGNIQKYQQLVDAEIESIVKLTGVSRQIADKWKKEAAKIIAERDRSSKGLTH